MKIGFIGFGVLGSELVGRTCSSGHTVLINNPSGNSIIEEAVQKIGTGIKIVSLQEVATAEIIVLFIPLENLHDLVNNLPDMTRKIIIHTGNVFFNTTLPYLIAETESFKKLASLFPLARCIQLFIPYEFEASNSSKKTNCFIIPDAA